MKKNKYWENRRKQEHEWQKKQIELDTDFDKLIAKRYEQAISDINDLIDLQVSHVSAKTHTNYAEMMKDITSRDVERWGKEAKELVKRANEIRKNGNKVTNKDFTAEENQRMKLYNATMRINRLEYLKSMTGAYLTHLTMDISDDLRSKLTNDAIAEQKRQAGLLGLFLPDYDFKQNYNTSKLIMQSTANATWSQRLWRDQDVLKAKLDNVLTTGFITGEHPRALAKKLRNQVASTVKNQVYVTERLARTESARIQYDVQLHAIKDNGFKMVWYFAEPKACDICQEYADHKYPGEDELGVFDLKDAPKIPVHPNCRCSIGSYMSDAEVDAAIDRANNRDNLFENKLPRIVNSITDQKSFTSAIKDLGITEVWGMNDIKAEDLQIIYKTMALNFHKHPELKGYLVSLNGTTRRSNPAIAWVSSELLEGGSGRAVLNINKPFLKVDPQAMVKKNVENGWFTKKHDYSGIINHEMAHAIDTRAGWASAGLDPNADNGDPAIRMWRNSVLTSRFSGNVLEEAFKEIGIDLRTKGLREIIKLIEENISKYPASYQDITKLYAEGFAEMYSSEDYTNKLKQAFDKVLSKKMKELYGDQNDDSFRNN